MKTLSALLREITSSQNGDFYCLNCFHSYSTKEKLEKHEKVCNDHDYCYVETPSNSNKILKYNHGEKSLKALFMIYADVECLLEKMHSCQNNPEKSYTEKKLNMNLLVTHCLQTVHLMKQKTNLIFTKVQTMERFCKDLSGHAMRILNFEEKEMILLTDKENKSYGKEKVSHICRKEFSTDENDKNKFKLYRKVSQR